MPFLVSKVCAQVVFSPDVDPFLVYGIHWPDSTDARSGQIGSLRSAPFGADRSHPDVGIMNVYKDLLVGFILVVS